MNYNVVDMLVKSNYDHKDDKVWYDSSLDLHQCDALNEEYFAEDWFRGSPKSKEEIQKILGREWRITFRALVSLCQAYKHIFGRKKLTAVPISCMNDKLCTLFGNQDRVNELLHKACKVGLLANVCSIRTDGNHWCHCYIENKDVQDLILNIAKELGIGTQTVYTNTNAGKKVDTKELSQIKLSFNAHKKYYLLATDEEIDARLEELYPTYKLYKRIADEINLLFYHGENFDRAIKFHANIRRTRKGLVSIGVRATNSLVSLKAHNFDENEPNRYAYLDSHFGKGKWMEFDVKSSIYRVTYLMNYDKWLDNGTDLYELMYGKPFESKEQRDMFKLFAMKMYFGSSSKVIFNGIERKDPAVRAQMNKEICVGELDALRDNMQKAIGDFYGSEIFLHESCLYISLHKYLLKEGYDVVQVYDGFYVNRKTMKENEQADFCRHCCELLETSISNYKDMFIDGIEEFKSVIEANVSQYDDRISKLKVIRASERESMSVNVCRTVNDCDENCSAGGKKVGRNKKREDKKKESNMEEHMLANSNEKVNNEKILDKNERYERYLRSCERSGQGYRIDRKHLMNRHFRRYCADRNIGVSSAKLVCQE